MKLEKGIKISKKIAKNISLSTLVPVSVNGTSTPYYLYAAVTAITSLAKGKKNINIPNMIMKPPLNPTSETATGKLSKTSYIQTAQNIKSFMEKNKRAPNYATTTIGKVNYANLVHMFARILNFYACNARLPNYVNIATTTLKTYRKGVWVWGGDVASMNMSILEKYKITDVFIGETGFNDMRSIQAIKNKNMRVHAWIICLKRDGSWVDPGDTANRNRLKNKVSELVKKGVDGIHLDYIRYPGTAYKYQNATGKIAELVKELSTFAKSLKPNMIVSAALMPEKEANAYYYGQDYAKLAPHLDVLIPMAYKGNYHANSTWIKDVTAYIKHTSKKPVWTGLQTYRSDQKPTPILCEELQADVNAAKNGGADGWVYFRYGLLPKP